MPPLRFTRDERDAFLEYIKEGHDPSAAARKVNPDYTGRMFRRIASDQSIDYDPEFAAAFALARAEGRERLIPPTTVTDWKTTNVSGHTKAHYLTAEQLAAFLEYVEQGMPPSEAAQQIEPKTSLSQLNKRAAQDSEFAEAFAEATRVGYPNFQEWIRQTIFRLASAGNYAAAKDLALIHLPEWAKLSKQTIEIGGQGGAAIKLIAEQALPEIPTEILDQMIAAMEQKQIESGDSVAA